MFGLIPKPYLILALVAALTAALGVTALKAYNYGRSTCEAAHAAALAKAQAETMQAAEAASRAETQRLAAEADAEAKAKELEDLAYAQPARPECGLDVERVLRLRKR